MIAFGSYPATMTSTHQEDYPLYSFSPVSTQAPLYPSMYFEQQQPASYVSHDYSHPQTQPPNPPANYILESQNHGSEPDNKSSVQFYSPVYSPRASGPNYFDIEPSARSIKSESAASYHSNLSSHDSPLLTSSWTPLHGIASTVAHNDQFRQEAFAHDSFDYDALTLPAKPSFVDPNMIQPISPSFSTTKAYPEGSTNRSPKRLGPHPPSPTPSVKSHNSTNAPGVVRTNSSRASPFIAPQPWNPYPSSTSRRQSVSSTQSQRSRNSQSSGDSEENKGICPISSCGRHIKDLKAHLLTHKNERPEKCPITSCEYHIKGFARKYDKNRHTLTHYKGNMICGFCPGSGSPTEKSFNRADVFKRHLTSVHGVDQAAPNSRRRSGGSSGTKVVYNKGSGSGICSTCGVSFGNVQDFYEHLDECVLRVIQQGDPCEAINESILSSMGDDKAVKESLARHSLSLNVDLDGPTTFDDFEDDEEEEKDIVKDMKVLSSDLAVGNVINNTERPRQGMTYSKGGVALHGTGKGNKRRKNYPPSWNATSEKTKMKKRVLCVFDGQRRLWKDDMMLDTDLEVREPLYGSGTWVTSLDVQTLRRAEGLLEATEEEKGPWPDEQGNPWVFSV